MSAQTSTLIADLQSFLDHFNPAAVPRALAAAVYEAISEFSGMATESIPAPVRPQDHLRETHGIDTPDGWDLDILVEIILLRSRRRLKQPVPGTLSLITVEDLITSLAELTISTEGDKLLRPAVPPPGESEPLLRPAGVGSVSNETERLMRASEEPL